MTKDSHNQELLDREVERAWSLPDWSWEPPSSGKVAILLTVLALGALLLVGLAIIPNFVRARAQGRSSPCHSNLKNISMALEMYSADHGRYPASLDALTPKYLKAVPWCPEARKDTYRVDFGRTARLNAKGTEDDYYLECHGENHTGTGVTGDYPAYTSTQGLLQRAP